MTEGRVLRPRRARAPSFPCADAGIRKVTALVVRAPRLCPATRGLGRCSAVLFIGVAASLHAHCGPRPDHSVQTALETGTGAPRAVDAEAVAQAHQSIRNEATRTFARSWFFKPDEASAAGPIGPLTPLIMIEMGEDEATPPRLGTWMREDGGARRLAADRATVYYRDQPCSGDDGLTRSIAYAWWYSFNPPRFVDATTLREGWRGVEMLLDEQGIPRLWIVRSPVEGTIVVFVSAAIESEAAMRFGPPAPGRRYAIERPIEETPDVVVGRVLDDGPIAMGPWVYQGRSGDVTTVACRCMTSQTAAIVGNATYALRPWTDLDDAAGEAKPEQLTTNDDFFGFEAVNRGPWRSLLRWPRG